VAAIKPPMTVKTLRNQRISPGAAASMSGRVVPI
jgi:hypothetical protein